MIDDNYDIVKKKYINIFKKSKIVYKKAENVWLASMILKVSSLYFCFL